jgi:protein-S-isoprenylcysteine O-methyltransferase Ste14
MVRIYWILFLVLIFCYVLFILVVFRGFGRTSAEGTRSSRRVRIGIIAQSLGYSLAWILRRPRVNPLGAKGIWPDILIAAFSVALAVGAIALAIASKKGLGKHWAMAARVREGHQLVTEGPFGRVRHPIYLAMGLLLLAPIAGLSSWFGVVSALCLFAFGTFLRVRAEEKVLREAFGREFDDYRRRVPAFIPQRWRV